MSNDICRSPCAGVGAKMFYGKRSAKGKEDIKVRLARQEKRIKTVSIPTRYKSRISGPASHWQVFYRQKDAFEFVRGTSEDLHVFSYESEQFQEQHGQRLYLAASYDHFWHFYGQLQPHQRHHYEVIPEGAACYLYFDLEYTTSLNNSQNGPNMVSTFIQFVCAELKMYFKLECDRRHILCLDASITSKFSQHLIFKKCIFQNNIHAGNFVQKICSDISTLCNESAETTHIVSGCELDKTRKTEIQEENELHKLLVESKLTIEDLKALFVKTKDGKETLFCDTGVYTKNRNFRLYLSSKLGKTNPLVLARDDGYLSNIEQSMNCKDKHVFMDSLVANIRYSSNLNILKYGEDKIMNSTLKCDKSSCDVNGTALQGYQKSPYPEVDDFISTCELISMGGVKGVIRHWTYFSQGEVIVYEISRNRWCGNIKRAHKSNNIMLLADLKKGVYYQKCHDPECHKINYKSLERSLPHTVLPSMFYVEDDMEGEDFLDDEDLLSAVQEVEGQQEISDQELLNVALDFD